MMSWRRLWGDLVAPALFGGMASLAFPPMDNAIVLPLAFLALLVLWRRCTPGRAAWRGLVFGGGLFGVGLIVIDGPFADLGDLNPLTSAGLTVAVVIYLAVYPAAVGWVAAMTRRLPLGIWAIAVVPATWALVEVCRSRFFGGMDWLALGYALSSVPVNGLAPVVGVHGLSFAVAATAGLLAGLYAGGLLTRTVACALVLLAPVGLWTLPAPGHWTQPAGAALRVALLQGATGHAALTGDGLTAATLARYTSMTRGSQADLMVWPPLALAATPLCAALANMASAARHADQTVLVGGWQTRDEPGTVYLSAVALGASAGVHHARHPGALIDTLARWLGASSPTGGRRLAAGAPEQTLLRCHDVAIVPMLGDEDMFARVLRRDAPDAGLLVDMVDDTMRPGSGGAARSLGFARMRAAEAGRPLLLVSDRGPSAAIDFTGHVLDRTAADVPARLLADVSPRSGTTPFMRYGDVPLMSLAGLAVFSALGTGLAAAGRERRRDASRARRAALVRRV